MAIPLPSPVPPPVMNAVLLTTVSFGSIGLVTAGNLLILAASTFGACLDRDNDKDVVCGKLRRPCRARRLAISVCHNWKLQKKQVNYVIYTPDKPWSFWKATQELFLVTRPFVFITQYYLHTPRASLGVVVFLFIEIFLLLSKNLTMN